ncbi:MAG: DMT family transporter [Defluviitaleaceae bacterium]|nr:DMT family transporter [Defluviitaleaceae bacterium]
MYYLLALLTGVLITVMVAFNGNVTVRHGLYTATVVIHLVGLLCVSLLLLVKREKPFLRGVVGADGRRIPVHMYLGGAVGVITVLLTNFAFGDISVSALMALGLFGQSLSSIAVDQFGLFGMARHPFNRRKIIGLVLMLCGIGVMVTDFGGGAAILAAVAAFGSGASIVTSRVLNARLAVFIGTRRGVFMTHITGLAVALPLLLVLGRSEVGFNLDYLFTPMFFIYLGGMLGVIVITLDNVTAVRIPAFYLALMLFVGQVGAGLTVDFVIDRVFSMTNLLGGCLVALGLFANVMVDKISDK